MRRLTEPTPDAALENSDILGRIDARLDALESEVAALGAGISQTTIDFGSTPVSEATFTIVDAAVVAPTYKVVVTIALQEETAENTGMDETIVLAALAGTGQFTLRARVAEGGAVRGIFRINYQVAA